uniref:OstA-like protein n=1 Tax=uncultured Porphyromonas sp. TaxID=159274 RepID=UPI00260D39D3
MNEGDPRHPFLLALALTLLSVAGLMATQARPSAPGTADLLSSLQTAPADTTGKERIIIEHVDLWRFDKEVNPDAQILTGNVVFKHDNALMYCDSALLYREANRFEAFGNVHIHQAQDTVDIYCNYLDYDGYTRLARLRELVQMEQGENTLLTDSLDYDRMSGIAYYFDYGSVADSLNVLSSVYAEYSTVDKTAVFYNDVVLQNDNFTLYSDTLHYDTNTKIATILGPTTIEGDSGIIYATRGTYRTEEDVATLLDRAEIVSGSRWMTGDSLIYDRPAHFADLYGSVILRDTAESMELRGNHVMYNDSTECGEAIDHAYIYEYSDSDHLFTGADRMQ